MNELIELNEVMMNLLIEVECVVMMMKGQQQRFLPRTVEEN